MATDKTASGLSMKVNIDVSEALTGLKALGREAKSTMAALKELSSFLDENEHVAKALISVFKTEELHEELKKREGVTEFLLPAHQTCNITYNGGCGEPITGPARIIINKD